MAKIRFGDYLKSKERQEAVYESDDSIAKRARALIDQDSCTVKPQFRVDNYRKAISLLEQIPDHPDAAAMLEECQAGLDKAQEAVLQMNFEQGKYHLESADTEYEFKKASQELAAVSEELKQAEVASPQHEKMLQKAEAMKEQADAEVVRYAKRTTRRRGIALVVVLLIIAAVLYALLSGYGRYLAAKAEGMAGIYESAYSRFYKLGDYLDSRSQYEYYKEKYLRQREEEESQSLPDAEVGDTVEFSGFSWLVLEKDDSKLTLICTEPGKESAFAGVSYDGAEKQLREEMSIVPETDEAETETAGAGVDMTAAPETGSASWESSSLRSYLNETVLEHEFTPAEQDAMEMQSVAPTSNEAYGTGLDEHVQDKLTILSVEQVGELLADKVFTKPSVDMWLRTPGHDMQCAAYMTSAGNVLLYGNDVTDDSLSVCPLIVVDYTKLEN